MSDNLIIHEQEETVAFPEPDPTIKISEALHKGSIGIVQIQHGYWEGETKYNPETKRHDIPCFLGACALGAACLAVSNQERQVEFLEATDDDEALIWDTLPGLDDYVVPPDCFPPNNPEFPPYMLGGVIIALNDTYGWDFNQIADWCESIGR